MRLCALLALLLCAAAAQAQSWIIASKDGRAEAGARFEIVVVAPPGVMPPDELDARLRVDVAEIRITLKAVGSQVDGRRSYTGMMPSSAAGSASLQLADSASNVVMLAVTRRTDALQALTGQVPAEREAPLSEDEPMYFIAGSRGPTTARFQLSFKYRLFDAVSGIGEGRPWLSGLYLGYTQNSVWDLSSESKAFRDTAYRPALFWKWERAEERVPFDGARLGLEHESNGSEGERSRSINIAFFRPEWKWRLREGASFEFTPKLYSYLDKEENTDIDDYRGYVDWRARWDSGSNWIVTALLRVGTANKGSVQIDLARRTRDVKFGPVSGYLLVQFFAGYGENITDYNVHNKSQIRFGFAIVP
jgi:phospholipase A1/A2